VYIVLKKYAFPFFFLIIDLCFQNIVIQEAFYKIVLSIFILISLQKLNAELDGVRHTYSPSTWEAEAGLRV
jgi:hypothetical protein